MQSSPSQATHPTNEDFGVVCALILVALAEGVKAILDVPMIIDRPNLLFGLPGFMPTTLLGIVLTKAYYIFHPLLVMAGLMFTLSGNLRAALLALGAIPVLSWLSMLSVMFQDERTLQGFWMSWWAIQWTVLQMFTFPVLVGIAIALAVLTNRYMLSSVLIALPTAHGAYDMAYFVIRAVFRHL